MAYIRRTRDQWQVLVNEDKDGGLTVKAFCQKNELNYSSFSAWKQRLSPGAKAPEPSSVIAEAHQRDKLERLCRYIGFKVGSC